MKYFPLSRKHLARLSCLFKSSTGIASLGCVLSLYSFTAQGQTANLSTSNANQSNGSTILNTVVITAADMSSPLTVVTNPKAPRQPIPASDGADYLKTIPGFSTIRNGGTNGDPVFRGMFGSRLNIVNDGSVIMGACPGRMDNPTSYISPESYDRLKVIKGPETVRWGPTGSAATILFERDPQHFDKFTIKGDSSIVIGTNNRFESRIDGTVGNKTGYIRVIGNKALSHDYHDGNGNHVPSKWDKWNGDLFIGFTPDADTLIEISGGGGDGEARYAGRAMDGTQFKRETLGAKFIKSNINDVLSKIEAQFYYNYADHIMDNFRLRNLKSTSFSPVSPTNTMGNMNHMKMTSMKSMAPTGMGNMPGNAMGSMDMSSMPMESRLDRRTIGGRLATTWTWEHLSLIGGVDIQSNTHRKRKSRNMLSINGWDKDAVFYNYGIFSEATWSFEENRRLVGGARLDRASAEDDRKTSPTNGDERNKTLPSAFLRYEHDFESLPITTYIGLGHTERFPDYWELFSPKKSSARYANAFDGIKPEKTTQLDFGLQYNGTETSVWASGYVGKIQDYILFDYSTGQSKASNVDATVFGGEAGISHYFFQSWKIDSSIAYAWGKNTSDKEALPQIPPFEGRIGLTYEQEKWSVGGLWRLVAKQNRIAKDKGNVVGKDFDKSADFGVFSLNGTYKISKSVQLTAGVDNIFNKNYYEHLNRDGDAGFGFPSHYQVREPGRTFWAKADFKF